MIVVGNVFRHSHTMLHDPLFYFMLSKVINNLLSFILRYPLGISSRNLHGKNDFAEKSKILLNTNLKIILLDH